jgi:hypothetical protein
VNGAFTLTLWRTFSKGRRSRYTWREFIDTFVKDPEVVRYKESVAGFSLASFEGNRRTLSRVEQVHALTLDFDNGDTTIEQAHRLLRGTSGVTYTTFSHSPECSKLRVIYALSRPVDADEYARVWDWTANKIIGAGHALDEATRDASRFWYLPSHRPGAAYEWQELEGAPLDVTKALSEIGAQPRPFLVGAPARGRQTPLLLSGNGRVCAGSAAESFFGRVFELAGMVFNVLDNDALSVVCPWAHEHTSGEDGDSSTVIFPPTTESGWGLFHCSHAHCARRRTADLLDVLPSKALEAARREHGAGLIRAKIRAGCVQHLDALPDLPALERFVLRCYPNGGVAPWIWTVKIGSRAHVEGLNALPILALRGRWVDLAVRGREITWGRLVIESAPSIELRGVARIPTPAP